MLAVANLRGGGEYGTAWHDAGRLASKQNVFDDFCACATWLGRLGLVPSGPDRHQRRIERRSAGRRVPHPAPGAVRRRRAEVGVLDMLRFHKFTIGWAWTSDFGDPDDPEQYRWLRAYSPLHNVRARAQLPADARVDGRPRRPGGPGPLVQVRRRPSGRPGRRRRRSSSGSRPRPATAPASRPRSSSPSGPTCWRSWRRFSGWRPAPERARAPADRVPRAAAHDLHAIVTQVDLHGTDPPG